MIITDERYWECDCENSYVHCKVYKDMCEECGMSEEHMPDARILSELLGLPDDWKAVVHSSMGDFTINARGEMLDKKHLFPIKYFDLWEYYHYYGELSIEFVILDLAEIRGVGHDGTIPEYVRPAAIYRWVPLAQEAVDTLSYDEVSRLDLTTANMLLRIYKNLSAGNQLKFKHLVMPAAIDLGWKLCKSDS